MSRPDLGLRNQELALIRSLAQLLIVLLSASCASGLGGGSPTSPALPNMPVITPIAPRRDTSPTLEVSASTSEAPEATAPTLASASQSDQGTTHTVRAGDTLLALARLYDVPMAAIQLENDMGSSIVVKTGQALVIPPAAAWGNASPFWTLHEVVAGETLTEIARDFDLDIEELRLVNGLDDADQIRVGQKLILPLASVTSAPSRAPTQTPSPTPVPTAVPTLTASPVVTRSMEQSAIPPTPSSAASAMYEESEPPADLTSWPREISRLINDVRTEHGLPPFRYDPLLAQAAQAHANDCAQRGWCSHTGSDGSNIKARVIRVGYEAAGWAECWAQTQTPQKAVEVWMDETPPNDPHRRTLLSNWLTEIGLGVSRAAWGHYIIADFGRP